jgi:hypothetical protein
MTSAAISAVVVAGVGVLTATTALSTNPAATAVKDGPLGTRAFAISYFYQSLSGAPEKEDCPDGFAKAPDAAKYFTDLTPEQLKDLTENSKNQAKLYSRMNHRGPGGKSVCDNPGLEPNEIIPIGQSRTGYGLDLDRGAATKGCGHADLNSPDGLTGVDNQYSRLVACIEQRRAKGYLPTYSVGLMRDGEYTLVVQVSGIDSWANDPDVDVILMGSKDPLTKSADGKAVVSYASFAPSDNPKYRNVLKGEIKNGVLTTFAQDVAMPSNQHQKELFVKGARLRLALQADGGLKGVMGGYQDITSIWDHQRAAGYVSERLAGTYTCPGFYNQLVRLADGYPDPKTGKCTAISASYTIEAVPAFVVSGKRKSQQAEAAPGVPAGGGS